MRCNVVFVGRILSVVSHTDGTSKCQQLGLCLAYNLHDIYSFYNYNVVQLQLRPISNRSVARHVTVHDLQLLNS